MPGCGRGVWAWSVDTGDGRGVGAGPPQVEPPTDYVVFSN